MVTLLGTDRTELIWLLFGLLIAGAVLFFVYSFVGTVVFGVFIYYATRPVYRRLRRYVRPPSLAAATALLALALPVLLLITYTLAVGLQELRQAAGPATLKEYERYVGPYLNASAAAQSPRELLSQPDVRAALQAGLDQVLQYLGFLGNAALHLFVMIAIAFYLLRDDHRLGRWFRDTFGDNRGIMDTYLDAIDRDFRNIFFGNILNAILTAILGAATYSVLNLVAPPEVAIPYAALLGLLTGAGSLIPVVGIKIVYFPAAGYLYLISFMTDGTTLWFPTLFVVVSFLIVDVVPDLGLRPYVSGRNLHVGAVMIAYIFGPLLFGWYGLFLGPIVLVLAVHFARVVLPELIGEGRPVPGSVDPPYLGDD